MGFDRRFSTPNRMERRVLGVGVLTFPMLLKFLSFLPKYPKLLAIIGVPYHVHVEEGGYIVCAGLNVVIIFRMRYILSVCPYFHYKMKVLIS